MKPTDNVIRFIARCNDLTLQIRGIHSCINKSESPIEQIFIVALLVVMDISRIPLKAYYNYGIEVKAQANFGDYRVDFALNSYVSEIKRTVVVELDGHEFHDRTEKQRRYEKERDRYLQSSDDINAVLHYTGKEITDSPFNIAADVLSHLFPEASNAGMILTPHDSDYEDSIIPVR